MFYLIYTDRINVGQFMALWFYSFFIFGPLQELGNIINVYRETEVSLKNFERHSQDAEGAASRTSGVCRVRWTASSSTT